MSRRGTHEGCRYETRWLRLRRAALHLFTWTADIFCLNLPAPVIGITLDILSFTP